MSRSHLSRHSNPSRHGSRSARFPPRPRRDSPAERQRRLARTSLGTNELQFQRRRHGPQQQGRKQRRRLGLHNRRLRRHRQLSRNRKPTPTLPTPIPKKKEKEIPTDLKTQGMTPVSLAEFTLASSSGQTFYDISLVDGYNLPLAIISLYPQSNNSTLTLIPPNLTNPVCIGTAALLASSGSLDDATLGTNASFPLPLDQSQSNAYVQRWCPWDLQLAPPTRPGDGVFPYPDDSIQRPLFNPCFSACAKYGQPSDCCTGSYDDPRVCRPSLYSSEAKNVCPDAYSYGRVLFWLFFLSFFKGSLVSLISTVSVR